MASGMNIGLQNLIDSDQAAYSSRISPTTSRMNVSYHSSQKVSPEEKQSIEKFYEQFE